MSYELIMGKFEDDEEAAVSQLERYNKSQDEIGIVEAVAVIKTAEGEDVVKILGDPNKKARRIGAVAGGMLGLLGGPAAMVIVGAGGAAAGNLVANLMHSGVTKNMINAVEDGLQPGSSAVIIIVEPESSHLIVKDLKEHGAIILSQAVESQAIEGKYMIQPSSGISET